MLRTQWAAPAAVFTAIFIAFSKPVAAQDNQNAGLPAPNGGAANVSDLPPVEVTQSAKVKKKKVAKTKVIEQAAEASVQAWTDGAGAEPAQEDDQNDPALPSKAAVTRVSGERSIGTSTIDITSQDLDRANPTDIKDVFKGQPGIQVGSSIPASQKVYVRGVEETNLSVTIDGGSQNNKVFHHNATTQIDPTLLKAVRVDASVAPADAGFGALGGSIAYETKDVRDLLDGDGAGGFARSAFNTNGDVFTNSVSAYGMSSGFEILGYFNIADGDDFVGGNGRTVDGTSTGFLSGLGKLAYQASSGDRFEISHEQVDDDAPRPFRANIGFISGRPPFEPRVRDYHLQRSNTVFNYSDATPEGLWNPKVVVAYNNSEVDVPVFTRFETYPVSGETRRFNGKFENKFPLTFGSVTAGAELYRDRASLDDKYGPADERSTVVGTYAQARIEPFDRTRISFGGRADQQWFTGTDGREWEDGGLSGNVSGEYDLLAQFLTAKAAFSHVWAGVPLAENFIMNPNWDYSTGPKSVTSDNYTTGLIARFAGVTLEASVFRSDIDDARVGAFRSFNPATGVYGAIRARDVVSEGYELGAGYAWESGYLRLKYAHIDVTIDGQPADSDTGTYIATPVGDIITLTGAHTFQSLGVMIGGDIEFAPEYDRVIAGSQPYESYKVINAFIEYRPQISYDLVLRADVRNIFDEAYAERATYGQEFGEVRPLLEPGRSFLFTANTKF